MLKIVSLLVSLLFLSGCFADSTKIGYRQVTSEEAAEMMTEETDFVILDVRTPTEYAAGHIAGAINLPNESIGEEEPAELPDKDRRIMVYCRSGNRSKKASEKLSALGYTDVVEFGGINTWKGELVAEE